MKRHRVSVDFVWDSIIHEGAEGKKGAEMEGAAMGGNSGRC